MTLVGFPEIGIYLTNGWVISGAATHRDFSFRHNFHEFIREILFRHGPRRQCNIIRAEISEPHLEIIERPLHAQYASRIGSTYLLRLTPAWSRERMYSYFK